MTYSTSDAEDGEFIKDVLVATRDESLRLPVVSVLTEEQQIDLAISISKQESEATEAYQLKRALYDSLVEPGHANEEQAKAASIQESYADTASRHERDVLDNRDSLSRAKLQRKALLES